jgi:hypothetical protein
MTVTKHGESLPLALGISDLFKQLAKKEQWTTVIGIFNLLSKVDRFDLLWEDEYYDHILQRAVKITNNCGLVVSAYKDGIRMMQAWEAWDGMNRFLLQLAEFHRTVVGFSTKSLTRQMNLKSSPRLLSRWPTSLSMSSARHATLPARSRPRAR